MMRKTVLIGLAMIAAPVSAQDTKPILWNDLTYGMPFSEMKALHPTYADVRVAGGCKPVFTFEFDKRKGAEDTLRTVELVHTKCGAEVAAGLAAKYGEPVETHTTITRQGYLKRFARYEQGNTSIGFQIELLGPDQTASTAYGQWRILYSYAPPVEASTAGL